MRNVLVAMAGIAAATLVAGSASAVPIQFAGNGHYYEYVSTGITWDEALVAAATSTYLGLDGYLATVTSADETGFLVDNFALNGWLSGTDEGHEGDWRWAAGPEAGVTFFLNGVTQTYSNWAGSEPNDCCGGEHHLEFLQGSGGWNDIIPTTRGYYVEYSAPGSAPEPAAWALMLTGFGGIGALIRRRRAAVATA